MYGVEVCMDLEGGKEAAKLREKQREFVKREITRDLPQIFGIFQPNFQIFYSPSLFLYLQRSMKTPHSPRARAESHWQREREKLGKSLKREGKESFSSSSSSLPLPPFPPSSSSSSSLPFLYSSPSSPSSSSIGFSGCPFQ